jgi:4-amino-4-deoxy-L-arabinose transferase-like glycosyltransferase
MLADSDRISSLKLALPGILLCAAALLPFLNKAFTIDDPLFLLSARQILTTPLQPMSYPICWISSDICVNSAASLGPLGMQALMGYILVPSILAGGSEWVAHTIQIFFSCVAVVAMVRLALRLGFDRLQAAAAGLMLVAIPPFLVMASTAMPDTLALALGLTGMERLLAWRDERRLLDGILASLSLGLAPFARPNLVLLVPFGALWLFKRFRLRLMVLQILKNPSLFTPVLAAAGIYVAAIVVTQDRSPESATSELMIGSQLLSRNLYSYLQYLVYPIPFAVVWLAIRARKIGWALGLPLIFVLVYHFFFPAGSVGQELLRAGTIYGFVGLVHTLYSYYGAGDRTHRLLALWMLLPVPAVFYVHMPVKYMLLAMPAIILIMLSELWTLPASRAISFCCLLIAICAGFSLLLLKSDADFAGDARRAAAEMIAPRTAAGQKVWFAGQWGFYWYAQAAGAEVLKPGASELRARDLVAIDKGSGGDVVLQKIAKRERIDWRHYPSPHGRVMGSGGAFYSGWVPWVWAPKATSDYELWRITGD